MYSFLIKTQFIFFLKKPSKFLLFPLKLLISQTKHKIYKGMLGLRSKFVMPKIWQAKTGQKEFTIDLASQM
jgi:hypothetical protein